MFIARTIAESASPLTHLDREAYLRRNETELSSMMEREGTRFVCLWSGLNLFDGSESGTVHAQRHEYRALYLSLDEARRLDPDGCSEAIFLGERDSIAYFFIALQGNAEGQAPELSNIAPREGHFDDLKRAFATLEAFEAEVLAYAKAIFHWRENHRYCGSCGEPNLAREGGHVLVCSNEVCGRENFPRIDPAIITMVTSGDRCLMGRQAVWPENSYSTLAGFVEPGETLESAVAREVFEETGVRVTNVRYRASQPWPFPNSIMLGFTAEAQSEEIYIDETELAEARWFTREEIRTGLADQTLGLPPKASIAYRLIEEWYDSVGARSLTDDFRVNWTVR